MLQLPEVLRQNAIAIIVEAIHPNVKYSVVNQTIKELQQLKPVEKPKTKGK